MKKIILFITLSLASITLTANTVIVDTGFGIDETKKLILINQDITLLNSRTTGPITSIRIEETLFLFENQINELEIGRRYSVKDEAENKFILYFTRLPLIRITTTESIIEEEKVLGNFVLTENDSTHISSLIGIRIRGGVSAWAFPKKSYRIEFWTDESGSDTKDISLLGMRSDDDWNLQAMYNEPLRATNIVGFDVWRKTNTLYYQSSEKDAINGSRWKYGEMFLNGKYQGVYGVVEPVDRKQLKLKKYNTKMQGELYKGLCTCSYNPVPEEEGPEYGNALWEPMFEYKYPKEIPANWDNLLEFRNFITSASDNDFHKQIGSYFNLESAVDYFIFMNLLRANDNKGKNLYLARYKADEPYFFVAWDLDVVFGLGWDGKPSAMADEILTNYFYGRLLKTHPENEFRSKVKQKWTKLRKDWLNSENIIQLFYERYNFLLENGIYEREKIAWPQYNHNPQESFDYLNSWLTKRITYLDKEFDEFTTGIKNPATDYKESTDILIYNLTGNLLKAFTHTHYNEELILSSGLNKGIYIVKIKNWNKTDSKKIRIH